MNMIKFSMKCKLCCRKCNRCLDKCQNCGKVLKQKRVSIENISQNIKIDFCSLKCKKEYTKRRFRLD